MRTILMCRWWEKNNKPLVAFLAASAALAMATLIDASSSTQVEQLGSLVVPRTGHAATVLGDGRVLITGGRDSAGTIVATAEIFDPATETSTAVGALVTARVSHTATLLPNGRVLIAGGTSATGSLSSAEIFDPSSPTAGFRMLSATMGAARARHTATLLTDGTVLIAGGDVAGTAEIFDPTTETFSSTLLTMAAPRIGHTATLFANDSVLLAGGNTDSMELFTPADQKFTLDSQVMSAVHTGQEAISLSDTRLFFFGGDALNTIEEFNPSADTLKVDGTMDAPASSTTLLANGKILVLRPDLAGLYEPDAVAPNPAFTALDETSVPGTSILLRSGQTATELPGDKTILVAGGANAQSQISQSTALFNPARIWTDKDDYVPTDPVVLSGSGWKANENVYLYAVDSETEAWTYGSTVAADANGSFSVNPYFIVQMAQLGAKFSVTAVGAQSAMQADVEFTDAGNFTYSPSTQSLTIAAGSNNSFSQSVTDPKNNGALTASPVVTGSGGNPLPASWVSTSPTSLPFAASSSDQTQSWTVKVTVPSGTVAGAYTGNIKANATGSGATPGAGQGTAMTITVTAGPATQYLVTSSNNSPAAGSAVTITAQLADAGNNPVSTAGKIVTWSKTGSGGSFSSGTSTTNASGVATVSFTTGTVAGTVYTVTATDNSSPINLTGTSGNITTTAGTATQYLVTSSDNNPVAGTAVTITAQLADASGNVVSTSGKTVTWSKTGTGGSFGSPTSTTNASGVATVSFTTGTTVTTYTVTATDNTALTGTSGVITTKGGTATQYLVTSSDNNPVAGTAVTITAQLADANGNSVSTAGKTVTWSKTGTGGSFGSPTSTTNASGVATVSFTTGTTVTTYTVTATDNTALTGTSGVITTKGGTAMQYLVTSSDNNPVAGTAVTIIAQLADTNGNAVSTSGKVVTWSKTGTGGSFGSPTSPTNASGVATVSFTTSTVATTYTVTATDNTALTGTSGNITTKAGTATQYLVTSSDNNPVAGTAVTITAQLADTNGNSVSTAGKTVTWSKTGTGGSFASPTSTTNASGVATVSFTTGTTVTTYTVTATDNTTLTGTSGNIITKAGTATKYLVTSSDNNPVAGTAVTITAQLADTNGNAVSASGKVVTWSKTGTGGSFGSPTSTTNASGVATVSFTTGIMAGTVYTVTATDNSALTGTSGNITTKAGTLDHFVFANIATQTAGTAFNITITALDANGNTVTTFDGNGNKVSLTSTGALTGAPISSAAFTLGVLTQSVTVTNTGSFTITATGPGAQPKPTGTSNLFTVDPGTATHLVYLQQPTNAQAGASIAPPVTVQVEDANNNVVTTGTGSTASVDIAILANPSSGTLGGTTSVNAVSGIANFSDLSINKGGVGYTLQATSTGLTAATSAAFTINNPAPTLASIAPTSGNLSDTLDVVFNGTNYISGVSSVGFGPNITVNSVTVNSSIKITANITIGAGAALGPRNVSVTNVGPGGGTATLTNGFTVNNPATTTTLDSSLNPSTYGDSVTFTATVTSVSGTPTGSVTFYDSATCSGTVLAGPTTLDVNGKAGFTTSSLTVPSHTITACYSPTGIYLASNGSVTQTVNKRPATWTTDANSKTYGAADPVPLTTGSGTGFLFSDSVTASYSRDSGETVAGGPYHITATLSPAGVLSNYNITNAGADFTIAKKDATWTTNANSKTYGDADPNPLTTGSGSGFVAADNVTATYGRAAGENASPPTYHITATLSPAGVLSNYNVTNAGAEFTINKKDATWTTNAASKTYGAADPVPLTTGSGTGFLFSDSVTASYSRATGETVAGGPYHITATLSPAGVLSNYNITNAGADFTIAKADATVVVTAYNVPYDAHSHTATVTSITGVNGETGVTVGTVDVSNTTHTNAATYSSDTWSFTGTANYNNIAATTITDKINKADATVVITPYEVPYDGHSHTATITSITGVNSETGVTVGTVDVSNTTHTNAATYSSDTWSFTGTANYNNIAATTITDKINKADATVVVTPYTSLTTTYNGNSHTATITSITGVNSETGVTVGTVDVSHTSHTDAGTYASDYWFFTGTANYNSIGNTTITDSIGKANATVVVTPYTSLTTTYDGTPHTAAVTSITGVNSETGVTVGTVDVSHTTHTPADTYASDYWFFTGTANYNDIANTTITDSIGKANATFVVTPYTSLTTTYDGNAHTAAVTSITGVNGETGGTVGTVNVSNTTHTNAGTYASDYWFFTGTANYNDLGHATITDSIAKANATVVVAPYNVIYNGHERTATVTSNTGVNSETGATVGTVNLANTAHTNAGTYSADTWSFTGTANYNDIAATTISDIINKADAMVVVTPYTSATVTYDGFPHTASVTSITGVNGETGATVGSVDVSHTSHTNAGTYAADYWFFIGGGNYNNIGNTTISDSIAKATPVVTWANPADITYGTALSGTQLNATFTWTVGGSPVSVTGTATYTPAAGSVLSAAAGQNLHVDFAPSDTTNYNIASGNATINVSKATPNVTWANPADIVYGTALSGTQLNATFTWIVNGSQVTVNGTATYTPAAATVLLPGASQNLKVDLAPTDTTNYNPATKTVQINVTFGTCPGSGVILQPINADGSSVFKQGNTVPVKFTVCDANGNPISDPNVVFGNTAGSITLLSAVRGTVNNVNDTGTNDIPDVAFRYSNGIWIFNMATSNLTKNNTYVFRINLKYVPASITFTIGTK